jgi:sporulation protein YlmC with PRC-barrel domain
MKKQRHFRVLSNFLDKIRNHLRPCAVSIPNSKHNRTYRLLQVLDVTKGRFDMKKTLTMIASAALLGSTAFAPLAMAQTTPAPGAPASPSVESPAATPTTPVAPATPDATVAPDTAASASGEYLTEQSEQQVSANDYIGKSIYTSGDESIGNVTDLIIQENGGIDAVVVGVGGFLGIGAKNVALPIDKVTVTRDAEAGTVRLTTMETADALKAAPQFMTLEEKRNAQNAQAPAMPDTSTTSSTTP